jgi:hypothetical protein
LTLLGLQIFVAVTQGVAPVAPAVAPTIFAALETELSAGDPGRIRTCDLQLRRTLLARRALLRFQWFQSVSVCRAIRGPLWTNQLLDAPAMAVRLLTPPLLQNLEPRRVPRPRQVPRSPYTAVQWSAIESAVKSVRATALTKDEKAELCWMAKIYRHAHARHGLWRKTSQRDLEERRRWHQLSVLSRKASALLASLEFGANSESASVRDYHERTFAQPAEWLRCLCEIAQMHSVDDLKEDLRRVLPKKLAKAAIRTPNAEQLFEGFIADFWEKLGGKLGTSWDDVTKRVFGPYVSFFEAVGRPVMKSKMPSLRSLQDIVRREKLIREAFREFEDMDVGRAPSKILHM